MFPSRQIARWWIGSSLIKLLLAVFLPLSLDESYYWVWSKNLQLSYFDHPAMVAWLFRLGHFFEALGNAVRWPGVILGQLTILILLHCLKDFLNEKNLFYFLILAIFSPFLGVGSLILTPDLPVLFFWSASLFFFTRILKTKSYFDSVGLGLSLGLGFCSKYHIVLFLPAALAYLFWDKKWKSFSISQILIIIGFGFLASLPVLIWNYQNHFSSFLFQINHGFGRPEWQAEWTLTYLLGQILVIFPIPFYFALRASRDPKNRLWVCMAWFPILFFLISSFRGVVEVNWPIIAYPAIYILAALGARASKWIWITCGLWLLCFIFAFQASLEPHPNPLFGKVAEFHKYDAAISATEKYSPLFSENFQMTSFLWYKTKKPIFKLRDMSRRDFYDELSGSLPTTDAFYVVMDAQAGWPEWLTKIEFKYNDVEFLNEDLVVRKVELKR